MARVLGSLDPAWALEGQEVEEGGYAAMAVSKEAVQGLVGALVSGTDSAGCAGLKAQRVTLGSGAGFEWPGTLLQGLVGTPVSGRGKTG